MQANSGLINAQSVATLCGRTSREFVYVRLRRDKTFPRPVAHGKTMLWSADEVAAYAKKQGWSPYVIANETNHDFMLSKQFLAGHFDRAAKKSGYRRMRNRAAGGSAKTKIVRLKNDW